MDKPNNIELSDYEILIRRRDEDDYASYCPQLAYMIKGKSHEEVEDAMKDYIRSYVNNLQPGDQAPKQ